MRMDTASPPASSAGLTICLPTVIGRIQSRVHAKTKFQHRPQTDYLPLEPLGEDEASIRSVRSSTFDARAAES